MKKSSRPSTPSPPPALHPLEAEVMDVIWDRGEASVREVMEVVERTAEKPRAYTTYMTILGRLDKKGLVTRRREGKTDHFSPVTSREAYADLRAQAEVAAIVDAFGDVALGHFARQMAELDPERRSALERLARGR
ncbi:MAG TPA: BlaI/MecI/CopY family transcriptional regulator [Baekduia sp.]